MAETKQETISGEQVKASVLAAGLTFIVNHDCSICGCDVGYIIDGERIFYRSACGCSWSPDREMDWQDAADWINIQDVPECRVRIASRFGLDISSPKT